MKNILKLSGLKQAVISVIAVCMSVVIISSSNKNEKDISNNDQLKPDFLFTNPISTSGPDPWVWQKDGYYYFTHTTGRNLKLYRTKRLSDLSNAESKVVWTPPPTGMNSKEIWAPELHFIQGKWYFIYAADDGDNQNHRMWVLENSSENPLDGEWIDKGKMMLPDDKWAIDASMFEHKGQLYCIWSGWEGDVNVSQNIYITKMKNQWTSEGDRVMLSKPELDWERKGNFDGLPVVNEGPQFLQHKEKIFIIYSASGCWTDDYALGMLSTTSDADLMDPASWEKHKTPVFSKNPEGQAFGPGHNGFFKSMDGKEDWIIYHANPKTGQGCGRNRSTRIQKISWKNDGTPDFGTPIPLKEALVSPSGE